MKMQIQILELSFKGQPATCTLGAVQYNARTSRWTANALWRAPGLFKRSTVTAGTFEQLVALAAQQELERL